MQALVEYPPALLVGAHDKKDDRYGKEEERGNHFPGRRLRRGWTGKAWDRFLGDRSDPR